MDEMLRILEERQKAREAQGQQQQQANFVQQQEMQYKAREDALRKEMAAYKEKVKRHMRK